MIINTKSYKVPLRYVELPPSRIFNWLDPFNSTARGVCKFEPNLLENWWAEETVAIRKKIAKVWTKEFNNITGHFSSLEESIKENGILTPISVTTGPPRDQYLNIRNGDTSHFPPECQNNLDEVIYTQPFGGSRLTIAQKLNIEKVPCVLHDFSNLFPDAPIVNQYNFQERFGNNQYHFCSSPPIIRLSSHSHLTGIYGGMNADTRKAQKQALKTTREKLGLCTTSSV